MSDAPAGLQNSAAVGVDYAAPGTEPAPEPQKSSGSSPKVSPASSPASFDPADHTVAEVLDYLSSHPDAHDAVMAAEKAGKARTSIVGD